MAGTGRYPRVRLDRDGPKACAIHVSNRAVAVHMAVRVWLMESGGVIVRHRLSSSTNESRFAAYVGEFTRTTPTREIERALERFVGVDLKPKPRPAYTSDPLNLALRDMPGSRVSLLGIAGVRITEELRAA